MMSKTDQETIDRLGKQRALQEPLSLQIPKNWPLFAVLFVLLSLLVLWAFLGRIPTEIRGKGVALSPAGTFLVRSETEGKVVDLFVKEGERIKKNTPIAILYNPELKSLLVQIEATEFKIDRFQNGLKLLEEALEINQQLFQEGLIAKLIVDDTKAKVYEKQIGIEEAQAEINTLFSKLELASATPKEEVLQVKQELLDGKFTEDLASLEERLTLVRASESGTVLEVLVEAGDQVERKESLVWVEHPLEGEQSPFFYTTVNADEIGRVEAGMPVLVEPLIVNPQEYGAIRGKVKGVYRYPVSEEELVETIGNPQIVKFLLESSSVATLLLVEPLLDPETPSGLQWTSKNGPPFSIPTGSVANVKLIIDEQPPISYLIPLWKIKDPFIGRGGGP
ncbi:MAG: Colicin V secretion protein CvaA [Chlamydiae bacterium]|nr:Colicin V secretion protein CvaA [Chlamydiota bacterium]